MTVSARRADLDDLIGAIYDCVIDPSLWHDTLDRIRRRFDFFNAMLGVNNTVTQEMIVSVYVNVSEQMAKIAQEHSWAVGEVWGGWSRANSVPLEEPIINSEVTRPEALVGNPYYEHFAKPQGINDSVAIVLARDSHIIANLSLGRHASAPPLTATDLDEMRVLAPHLRRAIVISRLLETSEKAARSFAEALDATRAGVVLVDRGRHLVHANRVARAMLAAGDPIRAVAGALELPGEVVPGALLRAITGASETVAGSKGAGVPARRSDGRPLTVQVLPLERLHRSTLPNDAVAAVFVAESATGPATTAEVLGLLFDLTPAEARIFTLIVEGLDLPEIATQLSISRETAKTHLGRIYRKTGKQNRVELLRLAQGIAPPA
jgi:DNA-binding CsgD family transcriptional regulator